MKSLISFSEMEAGSFPRLNTSSYSMIKGTDIAIENLLLGRIETNLYDAPRLDFKDAKRTFVSITIFMWYYISYRRLTVKHILLTCRTKKSGTARAATDLVKIIEVQTTKHVAKAHRPWLLPELPCWAAICCLTLRPQVIEKPYSLSP